MTIDGYDTSKVYIISVSGGRTSGYMLRQLLDHYGTLPDNVCAIFANTGKEDDATLDFVDRMSQEWNVPITWVEFFWDSEAKGVKGSPFRSYKEVDHNTASRNGEPFEQLIDNASGLLPNMHKRICTYNIKVGVIEQVARKKYRVTTKSLVHLLGIRRDERRRAIKLLDQCRVLVPLWHAGVTLQDVHAFWRGNDFDLAMPYNSMYGNCDLCFLKSEKKLFNLMQLYPERAQWWIQQEEKTGQTFKQDRSYSDMLELAQYSGEQQELFSLDDQSYDCFCGD